MNLLTEESNLLIRFLNSDYGNQEIGIIIKIQEVCKRSVTFES
jgi:hypothetical protein